MIDVIRAKDIRTNDIVTSVYNPQAPTRKPAGWRPGDPVRTGRFVPVGRNGDFVVKDVRSSDVHGMVVYSTSREDLTLDPETKVEVIR